MTKPKPGNGGGRRGVGGRGGTSGTAYGGSDPLYRLGRMRKYGVKKMKKDK